jgi:hypothetical protein
VSLTERAGIRRVQMQSALCCHFISIDWPDQRILQGLWLRG